VSERKTKTDRSAPGGWVKPAKTPFDIIQSNPSIDATREKLPVKMFTPDFKAHGALTKDVTAETTGSGKPSETSKLPVPEFKNYM
jgi:hypothetical protein